MINTYKSIFPQLKGSSLTDKLIELCLGEYGVYREEGGKPHLLNSPLHISVSHTNDTFALLVADCNVGLDIQDRKNMDVVRVAERFFSEKEAELVKSADQIQASSDQFFRIWTRKEAYAKYTGRGLDQVASGLEVLEVENVEFADFMLNTDNDCFCAVCTEKGAKLDEIQISYRE